MDRAGRRSELGGFLRSRRGSLSRRDFGLPDLPRQRSDGLRREEVATFAGVSVTWYTWLEQGRDVNPSRHVLAALARTLRMSGSETDYLLSLGGFVPNGPPEAAAGGAISNQTKHLLQSLTYPAFAIASDWTIVGWNRAYVALYPHIETVEGENRNLLWLLFTDPQLRELLPDWELESRHFVAEFRAESGPLLGSRPHANLIARLCEASGRFTRLGSI